MRKEVIRTQKVPEPSEIGRPFSNAVKAGPFVFLAGKGGVRVDTNGNILNKGDFSDQVRVALDRIKLILEESGTSLDNVVQVRVFLTSMDDFDVLNKVYREYFPRDYPVRTTIQAAKLYDDLLVEIDAIAVVPE